MKNPGCAYEYGDEGKVVDRVNAGDHVAGRPDATESVNLRSRHTMNSQLILCATETKRKRKGNYMR
jgi:hypothetical protein